MNARSRTLLVAFVSCALLLARSSSVVESRILTQEVTRPTPSSPMPDLRSPIVETTSMSFYSSCGPGCKNHSDTTKSNTLKLYYGYDLLAATSDNGTAPFPIYASGSGTAYIIHRPMPPVGTQAPGCPADSDSTQPGIQGAIVRVLHGGGWETYYMHMSAIAIADGSLVSQGQLIGTAGCTGANAVHLHFDIRWFDSASGIFWTYPAPFSLPGVSVAPRPKPQVDLVFVIDTTSSMADDIAAVKVAAINIVDYVFDKSPQARIALVDFRDFSIRTGSVTDYPYRDRLIFTGDVNKINTAIQNLSLGYGGDGPETQYCALMHAMTAVTCSGFGAATNIGVWRSDSVKFIVMLTDASALSPEPFTNYTHDIVAAAANSGGLTIVEGDLDAESLLSDSGFRAVSETTPGVQIYPIVSGGNPPVVAQAEVLASATGGKVFTTTNALMVVDAIYSALEQAIPKPVYLPVVLKASSSLPPSPTQPTQLPLPNQILNTVSSTRVVNGCFNLYGSIRSDDEFRTICDSEVALLDSDWNDHAKSIAVACDVYPNVTVWLWQNQDFEGIQYSYSCVTGGTITP